MSETYLTVLDDIKNDHQSGAWVVARKTFQCIEMLAREKSNVAVGDLVSELERVADEIFQAQPGMAQLINVFNSILNLVDSETSADTRALARKISGEAKRFDEFSRNAVSKVAEYGAELITPDSVILIHSNSSTTLEIIKKAHGEGKTFQIILTESRPMCEGRACAAELSNLGIPNIYLFDAAVGKGVERADLILLGADSVSEIELANKIGTKAICLLAKEAVIPCYAACESSKFLPQKIRPKKETPRDPDEVWYQPPPETSIENYYFDDDVPLELFTGIITEDGILSPDEVKGKIGEQNLHKKLLKMLK